MRYIDVGREKKLVLLLVLNMLNGISRTLGRFLQLFKLIYALIDMYCDYQCVQIIIEVYHALLNSPCLTKSYVCLQICFRYVDYLESPMDAHCQIQHNANTPM